MNSGSWAVTCCAFEEAASANAAIEKKSFFIFFKSVPGSWQRFIYYSVNCKVSGKGWNQTESSALIGLRIAIPPESSVDPPQLCVYTKSFTAKVPRSWKRYNSPYGASLQDCRADEFAKFMSVDFYSYALTLLYVLMLLHHVCKDTKKCCISQTFHGLFSSQKSSFFDSFDKLSFFAYISMINNILFLLTRAMTFFLHEKTRICPHFVINLPHNAYMVGFFRKNPQEVKTTFYIYTLWAVHFSKKNRLR